MYAHLVKVGDTFSPRLKEIRSEINPTSLKAVEKAHEIYKEIQYPLVPMSDQAVTGHQGLLLSSMDRVRMLNFGESVGIEFGFYATDPETHERYALVQEYEYPFKHIRYAGHRPTIGYFGKGLQQSKEKMLTSLNDTFKPLLR